MITGLNSEKERAEEAERVVNWAFRQFVEKVVIEKDTMLARADVWMGDQPDIGLIATQDVNLLLSALAGDELNAEITYRSPLEAPIAEGDEVAKLVISRKDLPDAEVVLVSDRSVARGGFLPRVRTAISILMARYLPPSAAEG